LLLLLAVLTATFPSVAQAQSPDTAARVEALYAEGAALFRERKYRAAIERFRLAYALYPDPNLTYNIARSHEALGELALAIQAFRRCLADPRISPPLRQKVSDRLGAVLQAQARVLQVPPEPPSPAPTAPATPRTGPVEPAPDRWRAIGVAKWAVGGVGLALLTGGAVAYGLGVQDHNAITSPQTDANGVGKLTRQQALDLRDSGQQKKDVGLALGAVGVAGVVTSAVLFVVQWRRGATERRAERTLWPGQLGILTAGPTGTTVGLRGEF
jgi:hypothetical protein